MVHVVLPHDDPAMELLRRPDLLDVMVADLDAMGVVGETANTQVLALAMVSRLLPRPVNVVMKGPSSSGKSFLVEQVAELFGEEAIVSLSTLSPKALYYMQESELTHRVLYVDEYMPHAERDRTLRLIQSKGRLVMSTTTKTEAGVVEAQRRTVAGPVGFITTTTRAHIFDENETRAFTLVTDSSDAQTARILAALSRDHDEVPPEPQYDLACWRRALGQLQAMPVRIPFASHIGLARTGQTRDRRDLRRVYSLIEASALLHQCQRARGLHRGKRVVLAQLEDYRVAWRLAPAYLGVPRTTDDREAALVAACGLGTEAMSHYDLMAALGWSRPTVIKYCQQAVASGQLTVATGSGGAKRYQVVGGGTGGPLTHPDVIAAHLGG